MHFLELAFAIMKFLLPSMGFKGNVFAAGFYWICHVMEYSTKALCELKIDWNLGHFTYFWPLHVFVLRLN